MITKVVASKLKIFFQVGFALLGISLPAMAHGSVSPKGSWGMSFYTRPEVNDLTLMYSIHDRVAVGFHGIRNHWPRKVELHYGLAQLNTTLAQYEGETGQFQLHFLTGLGLANKLKGVGRVAYLLGLESEFEKKRSYSQLRITTIGARDFVQKNFVRARTGFSPYEAEINSWKTLVMLNALYENDAEHTIEYGPVLRLQYRNVATEFYGNFKGAFSWEFSFYY